MSIETLALPDGDVRVLRDCPINVTVYRTRKMAVAQARLMDAVKRLQRSGHVRGEVKSSDPLMLVMRVALTDRGRAVLGRPPVDGVS